MSALSLGFLDLDGHVNLVPAGMRAPHLPHSTVLALMWGRGPEGRDQEDFAQTRCGGSRLSS